MVERKVTVNPRASAVVITNNPKHVQVNKDGIEKLKDEVIFFSESDSNHNLLTSNLLFGDAIYFLSISGGESNCN